MADKITRSEPSGGNDFQLVLTYAGGKVTGDVLNKDGSTFLSGDPADVSAGQHNEEATLDKLLTPSAVKNFFDTFVESGSDARSEILDNLVKKGELPPQQTTPTVHTPSKPPTSTDNSITVPEPAGGKGRTLTIGFANGNVGGIVTDSTNTEIVPVDTEAITDKNSHDVLVKLLTLTDAQKNKLFEEFGGTDGPTILKNLLNGTLPQSVTALTPAQPETTTTSDKNLPSHAPGAENAAPSKPETGPDTQIAGMSAEEVYCPFDSKNFDEEAARRNIPKMQQVLKDNPNAVFDIDAFCDKVGTEEYNQALGQARGQALQDFYEANDIPKGHIVINDHGKDGPQEKPTDDQVMEPENRGIRTTVKSGAVAAPMPAVAGDFGEVVTDYRGFDVRYDRHRHVFQSKSHEGREEFADIDEHGMHYLKDKYGLNLDARDGTASNSSGYRLAANGSPTGQYHPVPDAANRSEDRRSPGPSGEPAHGNYRGMAPRINRAPGRVAAPGMGGHHGRGR